MDGPLRIGRVTLLFLGLSLVAVTGCSNGGGDASDAQTSPDSSVARDTASRSDGGDTPTASDSGDVTDIAPLDGSDCGPDETFVDDACTQCAADGGCANREPRCVATCGELDDCSADDRSIPLSCHNGVCRNSCI